jgi:Family of unknown function (DUF6982)
MVVHRDGTSAVGYLNPEALAEADALDLLTPDGEYRQISMADVKMVRFVREFLQGVASERKRFFSRPKLEGLWVRLQFLDGDDMEGIIPNDVSAFFGNGIYLTPPDINANTHRLFVPRSALRSLRVLGVVGIARRALRSKSESQPKLFEE